MRTVKITIEVEVPDDCDRIAVDQDGEIVGFDYKCYPVHQFGKWRTGTFGYIRFLRVKNWMETLTKVDDATNKD